MKSVILNTALWFLAGVALLNSIVYLVYRTGLVYAARNRDGTLKQKQTWKGVLSMAGMFILIVLFLVSFDRVTFASKSANFFTVFLANFILALMLILYDSFFIDLFVLGKWKPEFLRIPEEVILQSMRYHVKKQFTMGWIIVIPLVLICTLVYYVLCTFF